MPLRRVRETAVRLRDSAAGLLVRARVWPLALTVLGLLLALVSGWLFYKGRFAWAALVLGFSGLCDLFDGAVARLSGRVTPFGAFLDSTVDRLSDAAILGGILLYYSARQADTYVVLAYLALVGSFLVSYTRARAECLVDHCRVGVFQRPARTLVLVFAGFAGLLPAALWVLAAATGLTVAQRVIYVRRSLGKVGGKYPDS